MGLLVVIGIAIFIFIVVKVNRIIGDYLLARRVERMRMEDQRRHIEKIKTMPPPKRPIRPKPEDCEIPKHAKFEDDVFLMAYNRACQRCGYKDEVWSYETAMEAVASMRPTRQQIYQGLLREYERCLCKWVDVTKEWNEYHQDSQVEIVIEDDMIAKVSEHSLRQG